MSAQGSRPRAHIVWGCVLALALVFVPAAVAANPVPNPGFEASCGEPSNPCSWTVGTRDEDDPHTGSASLRVLMSGPAVVPSSDCAPAAIPPGSQSLSFWYRSDDPLTKVMGGVDYYSDAGCSSYLSASGFEQAAVADGGWHAAASPVPIPVGVQGVRFWLGYATSSLPDDPAYINFDDVSLGSPTAVLVTAFTARWHREALHLRWRAASEVGVAGYRLVRHGPRGALATVGRLVPARTGVHSTSYEARDRTAARGVAYRYSLQTIGTDGKRHTVASVRVVPR